MSNPIKFNEIDFKENYNDFYKYMMYKGQPFTGTLIVEDYGYPVGSTEIMEFKDGNAHGRVLEYNKAGLLIYDGFFEDGDAVSEKTWYPDGSLAEEMDSKSMKEWYPNGTLKKRWDEKESCLWDNRGILVKKDNVWIYDNGQRVSESLSDGTTLLFSSSGDIVVRTENIQTAFNPETKTHYHRRSYYFDNVLCKFYKELFTDYYPDLEFEAQDFNRNRMFLLFGWVGQVYSEDRVRGNQLIDELINHPTKQTRQHAGYLKKLAMKKESGSTELTYWLESSSGRVII